MRGRVRRHSVVAMMKFVWIVVAICVALFVLSFLWAALKFLLVVGVIGVVIAALIGFFGRTFGGSNNRSY